ncbi:MAG: tetratricopeptide repeat protein, partial [Gammaproteobacteria bacterium]
MSDSLVDQKEAVARMVEQNRLQEACDLCHKICATDESDAVIWYQLGAIYEMMGNLDQVINYSKKAISLDPLLAPAYENIANALLRQDRLTEAAQCYWAMAEKMYNAQQFNDAGQALNRFLEVPVTHSRPRTAHAHMLRGACLLALGKHPEALGDFQKAVELQPENPQYQGLLGDTLFALTRFEEACKAYRQLLRLQPESPQAYASIAIVYERMNQLDTAAGFANQALERDPNHIAAILMLAKLDRRAGNLEVACNRLEGARAGLSGPAEETELYYESGIVYDRLGRYADAFELFRQGNELASQSVRAKAHQNNGIQYVDHLTTFRKSFTAERFARWQDTRPQDDLPSPVFFVGHPRSGTTLTEQILSAHPAILVSNERPFLDRLIHPILKKVGSIDAAADYLDNISQQELTSLRNDYWDQVEAMPEVDVSNKILIDKLPANFRKLG